MMIGRDEVLLQFDLDQQRADLEMDALAERAVSGDEAAGAELLRRCDVLAEASDMTLGQIVRGYTVPALLRRAGS